MSLSRLGSLMTTARMLSTHRSVAGLQLKLQSSQRQQLMKGVASLLLTKRSISSSEKKPAHSLTNSANNPPNTVIDNPPRTAEDFAEAAYKPRNWISYGYSDTDYVEDRNLHKVAMFFVVTFSMVGVGFFITFLPDVNNVDWSTREAYLELDRRERNGLPLVDRELVPVERLELPSEEQLVGKRVYL